MSNTNRHPECHMRTALGNCDPIGGFCTSINKSICEALHKVSRPKGEWLLLEPRYSIEQKVYWNKEQALADTKGNGAIERRKCSCCGYIKQFSGYMKDKAFKLWSFCPNCGALMTERERASR